MITVDIPFLLATGAPSLNENHVLLQSIVEGAAHKSGFGDLLTGIVNPFLFAESRFGGVTKIAFVATKKDLVHQQDKDNLAHLMKSMISGDLRAAIARITHECFAVSAVESTASHEGSRKLTGRPKYDDRGEWRSPHDPQRDFDVPQLPKEWPHRWSPADYQFLEVHPDMPHARFAVPRHSELNRVVEFLLQ